MIDTDRIKVEEDGTILLRIGTDRRVMVRPHYDADNGRGDTVSVDDHLYTANDMRLLAYALVMAASKIEERLNESR